MLRDGGYIPMAGRIADASLVAAPKQRNTNAGKACIKPATLRRKEHDACCSGS